MNPSKRAFDALGDASHRKDAQQRTGRRPFLPQQYHHEILRGDGKHRKCAAEKKLNDDSAVAQARLSSSTSFLSLLRPDTAMLCSGFRENAEQVAVNVECVLEIAERARADRNSRSQLDLPIARDSPSW